MAISCAKLLEKVFAIVSSTKNIPFFSILVAYSACVISCNAFGSHYSEILLLFTHTTPLLPEMPRKWRFAAVFHRTDCNDYNSLQKLSIKYD